MSQATTTTVSSLDQALLARVANSNKNFLTWIFGRDKWPRAHVTAIAGDPRQAGPSDWAGYRAGQMAEHMLGGTNNYYSVSLFRGARRIKADFDGLYVVGVDDVGTKVDAQRVRDLLGPPSYRLETSPGSEHWGYRLAQPITDLKIADDLITRLVDVLLGKLRSEDPGQRGVTRYMRLPTGLNGKPEAGNFQGRLHHVSQATVDAGWLIAAVNQAFEALGGSVSRDTGTGTGDTWVRDTWTGGGSDPLDDLPVYTAAELDRDDLVLQALYDLGRIKSGPRTMAAGVGWDIECPWIDEHTEPRRHGHGLLPGRRLQVPPRSLPAPRPHGFVAGGKRPAGPGQRRAGQPGAARVRAGDMAPWGPSRSP
jgi:hypothetical protein